MGEEGRKILLPPTAQPALLPPPTPAEGLGLDSPPPPRPQILLLGPDSTLGLSTAKHPELIWGSELPVQDPSLLMLYIESF